MSAISEAAPFAETAARLGRDGADGCRTAAERRHARDVERALAAAAAPRVGLWTAPYRTRDADRLDITRAGCDKAMRAQKAAPGEFLAPSGGLVFPALEAMRAAADAAERDAIWAAYAEAYRLEMLTSWRIRRREWDALLVSARAVLVCFCRDPQRCHRTLVAGFLARLGADYRGELP